MLILKIKNISQTFNVADYHYELIEDGDEAKTVAEGVIEGHKRGSGFSVLIHQAALSIALNGNPKPKDAE
jgi:hypothetical protein